MPVKCSLTKEQIEQAHEIFRKKCKHLLTSETIIIVDIESGEFIIGSAEDEGYSAYQQYHQKYGRGRPNMLYAI